jgi:hypothetical protein
LDDTVDGCDAVVGEYSEVGVEPMFVDCAQNEVGNVSSYNHSSNPRAQLGIGGLVSPWFNLELKLVLRQHIDATEYEE